MQHAIWDVCDPASMTTDCPSGTMCAAEDYFDAATSTARCVPYCDTARHDGVIATCASLDASANMDASALCTSFSADTAPLDIHPTRLGLCTITTP